MERTKIVCTIGPSSRSKNKLKQMIKAGMDCARLNFSHGTHAEHLRAIKNIRQLSRELKKPIPIIQDLQGPKIRVGNLLVQGITLKKNSEVILGNGKVMRGGIIPINFPKISNIVRKNDVVLLNDGLMKLKVLGVSKKRVFCRVIFGGRLFSKKGVNLPTIKYRIPSITAKDKKDLEFGIKNNVDFIALSFVQTAEDVLDLGRLIRKWERRYKFRKRNIPETKIISKIEKPQAIENIENIIRISDGIMIARGDLGVEMDLKSVPLLQKNIIKKCLDHAKPVITATQMLESMTENASPTRAEVSDVANSVIDHTDAVMLSAESATGKHPVRAVKIMNDIIARTEESPYDDFVLIRKESLSSNFAMGYAAADMVKKINANGIIVTSLSGLSSQIVSRFRPEVPIVALVAHEKIRRQMNLSWGIISYLVPKYRDINTLLEKSINNIKKYNIFNKGDRIIIVSGHPTGKSGVTNLMKIFDIK